MARTRPRRKSPSRIRYEAAHPTVSFRVGRETYDLLKSQMEALGQSFAGWVKGHLDQDEARASARAEVLARQRDGLGKQVEGCRRELAEVERRLRERRSQLLGPIEKEVQAERERRLKALEGELLLERQGRRRELGRLDREIEDKRAEVRPGTGVG